ncbi:predicted protein, partial [Nematostella vectensis]
MLRCAIVTVRAASSAASQKSNLNVRECYMLLGLEKGKTGSVDAREAYLKLAKQYHPDSGKSTADGERFAMIEHAYRVVLMSIEEGESAQKQEQQANSDEEDKFDIRHTAPQHRYSIVFYGGYGSGTPSMRERQFQQHKVQSAIDKVFEHKTKQFGSEETSIAAAEKRAIRRAKISGAIERLVEDLIQESISKGEFKNLPGSGKPLKEDKIADPYLDSSTRRLNKILIDTGYVPEWIALEKEIREDKEILRELLLKKRTKLGPMPFSKASALVWDRNLDQFHERVKLINGKIDKLNLVVPIMNRQQVHMNYEKEV